MGRIAAFLILTLCAGSASAQLKVHLLSPWAALPERAVPPALIMIQGTDPGYYPGAPMVAEGGDWFVYTFAAKTPQTFETFSFTSYIPGAGNQYSNGLKFNDGGADFTMGKVFLGTGFTEVWIIPQGEGKRPVITDIPPAKKVVYLLNPWPEAAPMIKSGSDSAFVKMRLPADPKRCGWYVHYFRGTDYSVRFKNVFGDETYGPGGLKDAKPIDLAAQFAARDTLWLLPAPQPGGPPEIRPAFPAGFLGSCGFPLAVTIRDFSAAHPDFEDAAMGDKLTKGMVQAILPADKKPAQGTAAYFSQYFPNWFRTDSANATPSLRNYETCKDLPMSKDKDGYWGYDSWYAPSHGYFPIDDFNRFNETTVSGYFDRVTKNWVVGAGADPVNNTPHNFHYCMEMHANFKYQKGQQFGFEGDDDVWVFIDNKLVIDLGGVHSALRDSVKLDTMAGLVVGNKYDFDLFYCERRVVSSNLVIKTSIFFEQEQSVFAKKSTSGSKDQWDIYEIISGDQRCGASKGGDTLAAKSGFKLSGPSVDPARDLPAGTSFGGVTVNAGMTQVAVDTTRITGLRPGIYTITYIGERSGRGGTVEFTVSGNLTLEFAAKPPVSVLKGTAVPAVVRTVLNGIPDPRADAFHLAPQAGLAVFADSALTRPIAAGTGLKTDSATGTLKIWVTATAAGAYKLDLVGAAPKSALMDTYADLVFKDRPKVATPEATPSGRTFSSLSAGVEAVLSDATEGAVILYTTDGSVPDTVAGGATKPYAPGTALPFAATTTLRAIAVKPGWTASEVMTETYTRIVPPPAATPVADPPGREFLVTVEVSLASATPGATILYTLDGSDPATVAGGATRAYRTTLVLSENSTLKAIAVKEGLLPSAIMTEKYVSVPPIHVSRASYWDLDGDGRIETVRLAFDAALPDLPPVLRFTIAEPAVLGTTPSERNPRKSGSEIVFGADRSQVIVTLAEPFPFGVTSLSNRAASGRLLHQEELRLLEETFPVDDSAGPVIAKARVEEPDSAHPLKRITLTYSEPVGLALTATEPALFKLEGEEAAPGWVKLDRIEKTGDREYVLSVDSRSRVFPVVGDSAAIALDGATLDAFGRGPAAKLFRPLEGVVPKPRPVDFFVTFPNGSKDNPSTGSQTVSGSDAVFIPLDGSGAALPGRDDGHCGGCAVSENGVFAGPVFHILTPAPVAYTFRIFSTLGEFVAEGSGRFRKEDLASLSQDNGASGVKYHARVIWTGRTADGGRAGTGAYVLQVRLAAEKDPRTGAPPTVETRRIVFGMLRGIPGS